jgi:TRAP-type mannitol/chloroaromatic compound transport system substrate-binding protein
VLQHLHDISMKMYVEQAKNDPLFNKILTSYQAFLADVTEYHKISEHTYYDMRERTAQ